LISKFLRVTGYMSRLVLPFGPVSRYVSCQVSAGQDIRVRMFRTTRTKQHGPGLYLDSYRTFHYPDNISMCWQL
jgi:hypothetical protein